jgi:putative tricarboxylic transport membrane protein
MDRDLLCGVIAFAIALAYLAAAAAIPDSAIGDSVGAAGVPHMLGYGLAVVSALYVGQRLLVMRTASSAGTGEEESRGVFDNPLSAFAWAGGAVVICAVFIFLFETIGYLLSVGLLVFAMSVYQGVKPGLRLAVISAGGAVALWLIFVLLLQVHMPAGIWADLI